MKKLLLLTVLAAGFATMMHAQPQTTPSLDPSAPVMTVKVDTMNFGTVTQ